MVLRKGERDKRFVSRGGLGQLLVQGEAAGRVRDGPGRKTSTCDVCTIVTERTAKTAKLRSCGTS